MTSSNHDTHQFGVMFPSNVHGVGSPADLLAFFDAVRLVDPEAEVNCPALCSLRQKPVFGSEMLALFEDVGKMRSRMAKVAVTPDFLKALHLTDRPSKLDTDAATLEGVFARIFGLLADAEELIELRRKKPDSDVLSRGSVRIGPIEPMVASRFFQQLPASAFDDADTPLWLRDEIFDEGFYAGKI